MAGIHFFFFFTKVFEMFIMQINKLVFFFQLVHTHNKLKLLYAALNPFKATGYNKSQFILIKICTTIFKNYFTFIVLVGTNKQNRNIFLFQNTFSFENVNEN